jgi:CarD family transcriptional regulator
MSKPRAEEHAPDDLDIEVEIVNIEFEIGDNVVYPHHGAGQVLKKEVKKMFGEEREYLTIKILHNDMTVMVPCENAGIAGLRRVIDEETVQKVLAVLQDDITEVPENADREFKSNRGKIRTGDVYELAEVVRNLAIREWQQGLGAKDTRVFTRAKKILASELMYALEKSEDDAERYLDHLLRASAERSATLAFVGAPDTSTSQDQTEGFWTLISRSDALGARLTSELAELTLAGQRSASQDELSSTITRHARNIAQRAQALEMLASRSRHSP